MLCFTDAGPLLGVRLRLLWVLRVFGTVVDRLVFQGGWKGAGCFAFPGICQLLVVPEQTDDPEDVWKGLVVRFYLFKIDCLNSCEFRCHLRDCMKEVIVG